MVTKFTFAVWMMPLFAGLAAYCRADEREWRWERVFSGFAGLGSSCVAVSPDGQVCLSGSTIVAWRGERGWSYDVIVEVPGLGRVFSNAELALDSRGFPHLVAEFEPEEGPRVLVHYWKSEVGWQFEPIEGAGGIQTFHLDSQDNPHLLCEPLYVHKSDGRWVFEEVAPGDERFYATDMALDAGDNPHFAGRYGNLVMYASKAAGEWHIEVVEEAEGVFDMLVGPLIDVDAIGNPHLVYAKHVFWRRQRAGNPRYLSRIDDGWVGEDIEEWYDGGVRDLVLDRGGTPHVLYDRPELDETYVTYAFRTEQGWQIYGAPRSAWELAVGDDGTVHAAAGGSLYTFVDGRFEKEHAIPGVVQTGDSLTADGDGNLHLLISSDEGSHGYRAFYGATVGDVFHVDAIRPLGEEPVRSGGRSLALSPSGVPHAVVCEPEPVFVTPADEGWTSEPVDPDCTEALFAEIGVSGNGEPQVLYLCADDGSLRWATRVDDQWLVEVAATDPAMEPFTASLAVGCDGTAHVAYYTDSWRVWYLCRRNGEWQRKKLRAGEAEITGCSVVVGPDGAPLIAFATDPDSADGVSYLWVARRTESGWEVEPAVTLEPYRDEWGWCFWYVGQVQPVVDALGRVRIFYAAVNAHGPDWGPDRCIYCAEEVSGEWRTECLPRGLHDDGFPWSATVDAFGRPWVYDEGWLEHLEITSTTHPPDGALRPGWTWLSFPLIPIHPYTWDPASILGFENIENRLFRLDPWVKQFEIYPTDFADLAIGRGYLCWLPDGGIEPEYEGRSGRLIAQIALPVSGWSLIGTPHDCDIPLGAASVRNETTNEVRTAWQDAHASDPWMNWNLVYFDPTQHTLSICAVRGGDDDCLRPWHAYYLWSEADGLSLKLPHM